MLICRTPFRISLGGGSTDLPSYSRKHGGFIFGFAIKMYVDITVRKPVIYDRIDLQYKEFESVTDIEQIKHLIGREALRMVGINKAISIYFKSDTPMGTGLGGSGSCAVGLLNALWWSQGAMKSQQELAEAAFRITQILGLPDGKQDPYIGALGGFVVMEIAQDDTVTLKRPDIDEDTVEQFINNSLFFYTGIRRDSVDILRDQSESTVMELKHRTKELGREVLNCFVTDNLDQFGLLMREHWKLKKEMSDKITIPEIDEIHEFCLKNGALGGKLIGAGGGGYFLFYCATPEEKLRLAELMAGKGMKIIPIEVDRRGTRVSTPNL